MHPALAGFYAGLFGTEDATAILVRIRALQLDWNVRIRPCRGLRYMKALSPRGHQYCRSVWCPSCWHRNTMALIHRVEAVPAGSHFYFRMTSDWGLGTDPVPREIRALASQSRHLRLVASTVEAAPWSPDWYGAETEPAEPEPALSRIRFHACGLWAASHDLDSRRPDVLRRQHRGTDPSEVVEGWLQGAIHPAETELWTDPRFGAAVAASQSVPGLPVPFRLGFWGVDRNAVDLEA